MSAVELVHITVRVPTPHAAQGATLLDDVSLTVDDGELLGVVGASGSGKTTLLRVIAGLQPLAAGTVLIDGTDVNQVGPAARDVGMVFQDAVLIPTRDVQHNIAFPLELRRQPDDEIAERVGAETRALHIESLLARAPHELSAGEAQLVQIARALVRVPSVLLLDEPLANLDAAHTQRMRHELRLLQQGYGVTTVLATNDPLEAMAMPDRLVVLDAGSVVQVATPTEVFDHPATLIAAACTGHVSLLHALVEADTDGFWLVHPAFRHRAWRPSLAGRVGSMVVVAVRPSWVRVAADGPVAATVDSVSPVTRTITVTLDAGGNRVEIATGPHMHRVGERLSLHLDEVALFDAATGFELGR